MKDVVAELIFSGLVSVVLSWRHQVAADEVPYYVCCRNSLASSLPASVASATVTRTSQAFGGAVCYHVS